MGKVLVASVFLEVIWCLLVELSRYIHVCQDPKRVADILGCPGAGWIDDQNGSKLMVLPVNVISGHEMCDFGFV